MCGCATSGNDLGVCRMQPPQRPNARIVAFLKSGFRSFSDGEISPTNFDLSWYWVRYLLCSGGLVRKV